MEGETAMYESYNDIMSFIEDEDIRFVRLAFVDIAGIQKNISIMPDELRRAFEYGIAFDASSIEGFGDELRSDLFLKPIPQTIEILPWRPSEGRVARMFCNIYKPDGTPFELDSRRLLKDAVRSAKNKGLVFNFGAEFEFYLFKRDEIGNKTKIPFDNAGYMDIAPEDKGEDIRREICLTLLDMDIFPESSHHEMGPGQNEIDFRYSDALTAADNAVTFKSVVSSISNINGLCADFSPKPLPDKSGSGLHINISAKSSDGSDYSDNILAGILAHIGDMTAFMNSCEESYLRLGKDKAPKYVTWSPENRSQLIRIPAAKGEYKRLELRSPDASANLYVAYALLIYAALDGIEKEMLPPEPLNINLYTAEKKITDTLEALPETYEKARERARNSEFIKAHIPAGFLLSVES